MSPAPSNEETVTALARVAYLHGEARFMPAAERSALIVVDMQEEFVKPGWTPWWVPEATRQVETIRRLIEACRARRVPVIYTVFSATHHFLDRPKTGPLMPNRAPAGEGGHDDFFRVARIVAALAPEPGDVVIHKPSYGAFYDTPLQTILRNLERDTIIVCGTLTNYCCGMTARQGYERGFYVVLGSDVCSTDDSRLHEAELQVLRRGFARVLTCAEIVAELERGG